MSREGRLCILTISNCHGDDTDEYNVRVSNRGGTKYSRAPLAVNSMFTPSVQNSLHI